MAAGGTINGLNSNSSSNSLDMMGSVAYSPYTNLQTSIYVERRTQAFLGVNYGVDSYGASASYSHKLAGGNFNTSLTMAANYAETNGSDTLSFSTNENYSTIVRNWRLDGYFGYSQNMETLLVTYMNSYFQYSGNASRRWGKLILSMGGGSSQTGLTDMPGTVNRSEDFNASAGFDVYLTVSGSYSRSSGQAIATGSGLSSVPVPSPVLPSSQVTLYGGTGYSYSLGSTPLRGLILTATYGRSNSNTSSNSASVAAASLNDNDEFNALIQYQFRKMYFTSGYSRLGQGFSGTGLPPEIVSSFYVGVSRWFNFF